MESEQTETTSRGAGMMPSFALGWKGSFVLGLITLILGVIVAFRPTLSLVAIAVLLGVLMIVSGIYQIARAIEGREHERMWRGISGVLFILAGIVLIRHLHLTLALIGLFIGFTWVIQGIASLVESFSSRGRGERGWSVFFGIVSLIAGIVVISAPIGSVATLTIFMGAWFIVMGIMQMAGALTVRRLVNDEPDDDAEPVSVPGQRGESREREAQERRDFAG
jgi:uncharacterized membrane protein HdeD (DUF308 family)